MNKSIFLFSIVFSVLMLLGNADVTKAQLRKNIERPAEYSGRIIKDPSKGANWGNLFNMKMSQSYSMTFASVGGQYQNLNAYTNTMQFFFSKDLTGRVDLSILHSPFGNSSFTGNNNLGARFLVRNAELDYKINDKSRISIHFQQLPGYGYGNSLWSGAGYYNSPFYSPFGDRNF